MKNILKKIMMRMLQKCSWTGRINGLYQQLLLKKLLDLYRVDTIFDIGANNGMSGVQFREIGFSKKMVSFEPIQYLFEALKQKADEDPLWDVEYTALGECEGECEINVSGGHAGASSILTMTENVKLNASDQCVVRKEMIQIDTLDRMMEKHYPTGDSCFLKLDVQGFEKKVLEGGLKHIDQVIGLKIEMSLVENYENEPLMLEMLPFLYDLGFRLVNFENGWANKESRELYQVECLFFRADVCSHDSSKNNTLE